MFNSTLIVTQVNMSSQFYRWGVRFQDHKSCVPLNSVLYDFRAMYLYHTMSYLETRILSIYYLSSIYQERGRLICCTCASFRTWKLKELQACLLPHANKVSQQIMVKIAVVPGTLHGPSRCNGWCFTYTS